MPIEFHSQSKEFHIYNNDISYILYILPNNQIGNLYYGKRVNDKQSFKYLFQEAHRSLAANVFEDSNTFSLQHTAQEYPAYGVTDFHYPAFEIKQNNGSRITCFEYQSHSIYSGKNKLIDLPSTYVEEDSEAQTLEIILYDKVIETEIILFYTIFNDYPVIARSTKFIQKGNQAVILERAMSACVDLPDSKFNLIHLAGAWSRERHIKEKRIEVGIQAIYSMRGTSSAEHNPFIALKRPNTDEFNGEVYGFSLIYSGNHLEQVELDTHDMTRITIGIHPDTFEWQLNCGESFQTPEAILVYSNAGLNKMSQTFHKLFRTRLVTGQWRDKVRPILINNWEATEMNFTEDKILSIARASKELGIELFVLDDGWFGKRDNDRAGLGDWYVSNFNKLPSGIAGLADKIESLGMSFGLWFEPEMVNKDSDLYRAHPEWIISTPNRRVSVCRNQYVLDFSRKEVVDYIYSLMERVLSTAKISYVKWDMNRYITECYSADKDSSDQGKVFHQYILGVYSLYQRLTMRFPHILFESCSSGGARFDPGILHYAPQTWTSDDTDAIERLKIQYGTSMVYPISSMGAHVSACPNLQVGRTTPIETRANVAFFGVLGYELDITLLSVEEKQKVKDQISFYKAHRHLLLYGNFYRISSPFEGNIVSWVVVSEDKSEAIAGYYKILNGANEGWKRFKLAGLEDDKLYILNNDSSNSFYGNELMNIGIVIEQKDLCFNANDFSSVIYYIKAI